MNSKLLNGLSLFLIVVAISLVGFKNLHREKENPLLNVSYDPTRELYQEINTKFVPKYEEESGKRIGIEQSHGGSTRQAKAVAEGLSADVVTLALPSDIDILAKRGLLSQEWQNRLPHDSQPYYSTIVFVVRKGNPKHIKDWNDLIASEVSVITPDPKTSGNGKLSFLAAWGSVISRGESEEAARAFVKALYEHVPVFGQGARNSSNTFALAGAGDVHLTWENEALREVKESKGDLEIVYPPVSIKAEPSVAWVDTNVLKHHSEATAKAYLSFLYSDTAQEILAKDGYRPIKEEILKKYSTQFPAISLFPVTLIAKDWEDAQVKFFGENGIFEVIHPSDTKSQTAAN